MEVLDFADFDRRFELKINEASEDLIAKKEQGKCSYTVVNMTSVLMMHVFLLNHSTLHRLAGNSERLNVLGILAF